jgi:hypothetical protein
MFKVCRDRLPMHILSTPYFEDLSFEPQHHISWLTNRLIALGTSFKITPNKINFTFKNGS